MALGSAIEAGEAFVKLFVENKEFQRDLAASLASLNRFGRTASNAGRVIAAAGAVMTAPFVGAVTVFKNVGDELFTLSQRTGINVKSLSELKFAAQQTGTSLETIGKAAAFMQSKGLDPAQFDQVAASISSIADPTMRAQAAFEAFGRRAGAQLIPMLGNLKELRQQARDLGLVMDPEGATKADALDDAFNALKLQSEALASAIGEAVAPAVTSAAEAMARANKVLISFVKEHDRLVQIMAVVGTSLFTLGSALAVFGDAVKGAAIAINGLRIALSFLSRHPWVAGITIALTVLTSLAAMFIDLSGSVDTATAAVDAHTAAEASLADALDKGTKKIDIRAEALKRLSAAERAALKRSESREQDENIGKTAEELRTKAQLVEVEARLKQLRANAETIAGLGPGSTIDGMTADDVRRKIKAVEEERDKLLFAPRRAEGSPFSKFKGGRGQFILQVLPDLEDELHPGRGQRGGFPSRPVVSGDVTRNIVGPTGTFSGQLASQIFGGPSGGLTAIAQKQLRKAEETLRQLQELNDKVGPRGVGPQYKFGLS